MCLCISLFNIMHDIIFQITNGYELYVIFEPTVDKSAVITLVNKLLGWIKKEEEMLFILQAPTF